MAPRDDTHISESYGLSIPKPSKLQVLVDATKQVYTQVTGRCPSFREQPAGFWRMYVILQEFCATTPSSMSSARLSENLSSTSISSKDNASNQAAVLCGEALRRFSRFRWRWALTSEKAHRFCKSNFASFFSSYNPMQRSTIVVNWSVVG